MVALFGRCHHSLLGCSWPEARRTRSCDGPSQERKLFRLGDLHARPRGNQPYSPAMALSISDICDLLVHRGGKAYDGEAVTQLEHALQSAARAEAEGASVALVAAALLHDFGHLLKGQDEMPTQHGIDDGHQYAALPFLRSLFGDDVLEPIRLHVDAKRYLCATRADYFDTLSPVSQRSLALQGGVYSAEDARAFQALPYSADAVRVRLWDERAKEPGAATPTLAHFVVTLEAARG